MAVSNVSRSSIVRFDSSTIAAAVAGPPPDFACRANTSVVAVDDTSPPATAASGAP